MEYELRIIVEKVSVFNQAVVRRDTIKTYDVERPESILELGLRPNGTKLSGIQIAA